MCLDKDFIRYYNYMVIVFVYIFMRKKCDHSSLKKCNHTSLKNCNHSS